MAAEVVGDTLIYRAASMRKHFPAFMFFLSWRVLREAPAFEERDVRVTLIGLAAQLSQTNAGVYNSLNQGVCEASLKGATEFDICCGWT